MDRSDERKEKRSGDILGLGGITGGGRDETEPRGKAVDEDQQRRRRRMNEGVDDMTSGSDTGGVHRGAGATGIDMGAGGEGTDVE